MGESIDQSDGIGGKHAAARHIAEQALRAQAAGDEVEADRLFAEANRIDPEAVIAALQERVDDPVGPASDDPDSLGPQDDDEIAAMSRTVEPGSDAPSRSGIGGAGSGADTQDT